MGAEVIPAWTEALLRLLTATAVGAAIGLNRELTQKPAGLRTHALVSLGSALMMLTSVQLGAPDDPLHADASSRVLQGIVAGIGFLGAGVILRPDGRDVKGLTTAATIWVAAALGAACGIGHWEIAAMTVSIALVVLVAGQWVERRISGGHEDDDGPKSPPR